eukprot:PhF_6_TR29123/c0_g1_i1/m.42509
MSSPLLKKIPSKHPKEQPSLTAQLTTPTSLAIIVCVVCVFGALLAFTGPDSDGITRTSTLRAFDGMLKRVGVRRRFVDIMCNDTSRSVSPSGCYTYAKTMTQRGETVIKIPQELIIDYRGILERDEYKNVLGREENGTLDTFIKQNNLEQAYFYFIYSYFLITERNKGSYSSLAEWIAILPKENELTTGLQWPAADDECLDENTKSELSFFRNVLEGVVQLGEHICQTGSCTPFPIDDLRWGISIYRSRSLQDQALVIPVDFVNHGVEKANLAVEWNAEEKVLDVKLMQNVNKGDELFIHYGYGRSAASILISHGFVEDSTSFFPANVNMDVERIPLLKKLGCDRKYEIGYMGSGRPRQVFQQCISALVMTEEQRGRYKQVQKTDTLEGAENLMYTFGNITYGIQSAAQKTRPSQEALQKCADRDTPYLRLAKATQEYTMGMLVKAYQYNMEQYEKAQKKFVKLGGVLPKPEEQGGAEGGSVKVTPGGEGADTEAPADGEAPASP